MSDLLRCACCGTHVRAEGHGCPCCGGQKANYISNTASVALLGLALSGCIIVGPQPKYGMPESLIDSDDTAQMDADGDSFAVPEDCNDQDPNVHPGATETPADGIDSNCDGADDT